MIVTEENGEYYCYGKIMSKEEILSKLNEYEYETRRRTLHTQEELFKERAVNQHLIRENRLLIHKIIEFSHRGPLSENDIIKSLVEIDDNIFAELQKTQLENEKLKKELYFLKH